MTTTKFERFNEMWATRPGFINSSKHIVQIQRLGYKKKLQEKSEAAMRTPLQSASK